jgi:hypothetical protein
MDHQKFPTEKMGGSSFILKQEAPFAQQGDFELKYRIL